jgi:hypothetical protein
MVCDISLAVVQAYTSSLSKTRLVFRYLSRVTSGSYHQMSLTNYGDSDS